MNEDQTRQTVKRTLAGRFGVTAEAIRDDEPVFAAGLGLDSMAALELVTALEETFGVRIEDADMTAENFETVDAVARLMAAVRERG